MSNHNLINNISHEIPKINIPEVKQAVLRYLCMAEVRNSTRAIVREFENRKTALRADQRDRFAQCQEHHYGRLAKIAADRDLELIQIQEELNAASVRFAMTEPGSPERAECHVEERRLCLERMKVKAKYQQERHQAACDFSLSTAIAKKHYKKEQEQILTAIKLARRIGHEMMEQVNAASDIETLEQIFAKFTDSYASDRIEEFNAAGIISDEEEKGGEL